MNKRDKEGFCYCPECGRRFPFVSTSVYRILTGKTRTYYCSYSCWRKNGGDNKKLNIAGHKVRGSENK